MHTAMKRRLDGSPAFQNKPFRSPLRKASKAQSNAEQNQTAEAEHDPASCGQLMMNTSGTASPTLSPSSPLLSRSADVEHRDPQKQHSALTLQLANLRQSLNTAQQALEIEASNQDSELLNLIGKWRAVAQDAAEELFSDVKERVDSMGGVQAWRRRSKEDAQLWNSNEEGQEQRQGKGGAGLDGMAVPSESEVTEGDEEEELSFTLEMMLRQLNVDLQLIGYDQKLERWVE